MPLFNSTAVVPVIVVAKDVYRLDETLGEVTPWDRFWDEFTEKPEPPRVAVSLGLQLLKGKSELLLSMENKWGITRTLG